MQQDRDLGECRTARRCGAIGLTGEAVHWRLWAPFVEKVELVLLEGDRQRHVLMKKNGPFFSHTEGNVPEGQRYAYRLDGGPERPDPCSLWQPDGVHGPSAIVRPDRFTWTDDGWNGVSRDQLIFYEVHVGTFTQEGTFEAIIPRLRTLQDLGVTAIQIMPVGQFPGTRNWGYDGVHPYAVQNSYGGPHGLQRLVDACHDIGLAVFLDVVYNHLGPEGNYLHGLGPYFTDRYTTPWGKAVNYDGQGADVVRDYVLDNAAMWLEEYHVDGLRLDAVHAIYDLGAHHVLRSIQEVAESLEARLGRPCTILAESDLNDPRLILPPSQGGFGLAGQWADDFHHAVHTVLTGESQGYYQDFGQLGQLAQVMTRPYLYAGEYSPHRGRRHGAPIPEELGGDRFVVCIQNHDQVGNRAAGDRLSRLVRHPAQLRLAASLLLLSPYLPLLFMGEEYGEEAPFPFFCSFTDPQLVQMVREGRSKEFAGFAWQGEMLDPQDEATFQKAILSWSWPEGSPREGLRHLYQDLLAARRAWPALRDCSRRRARLLPDPECGPFLALTRGSSGSGQEVQAIFNLSDQLQALPGELGGAAWLFSSELSRYGGSRQSQDASDELAGCECIVLGPEV